MPNSEVDALNRSGKPKDSISGRAGGELGNFFAGQRFDKPTTIVDRARDAVDAFETARTPSARVLARQKLERFKASLDLHHRPHPEAVRIINTALARAEKIGGTACR